MKRARFALPALLAGLACGRAPVLEDYSYRRGFSGEAGLKTEITYVAGRLELGPAPENTLFDLALRYDPDRFRPIGEFAGGSVKLGTQTLREGGVRLGRGSRPQTARIGLGPRPDLDLEITLGAAEARLELGGLRLTRFRLISGASRSEISFETPNPGRCESVRVSSGAGEVRFEQAGNSGCPAWSIDGGVGRVTVDLAGAWPADPRFTMNLAVGGAVLLVPRDLGVRVRMTGLVARFDGEGFESSGKTWTSAGFDRATRKVTAEISSAVGGVRVEWK